MPDPIDIAIITIKQEEFEAVLEHLPDYRSVTVGRRRYVNSSVASIDGRIYRVAIGRPNTPGDTESHALAVDMLTDLSPSFVLIVGVASKLPWIEMDVGDVVVSTHISVIRLAASEDAEATNAKHDREVVSADPSIAASLPAFRSVLGDWDTDTTLLARMPSDIGEPPLARDGAIASTDIPPRTAAGQVSRSSLTAVETGGSGVYTALGESAGQTAFLTIRGVSHTVGAQRNAAWTRYACHTAASFAVSLIKSGVLPIHGRVGRQSPDFDTRNGVSPLAGRLEYVKITNVGPSDQFEVPLGRRLNIITGDNGLGKSFLLDIVWWALTRTWARMVVLPPAAAPPPALNGASHSDSPSIEARTPSISFRYRVEADTVEHTSTFDPDTEEWIFRSGGRAVPGLVVYAQVDGSFSIWDPARNYGPESSPDRLDAFRLTADEVWSGNSFCEGLIRDWSSWQLEESSVAFRQLRSVLHALSPSPSERIEVGGRPRKISLRDPKRYPLLKMPYGEEIPVVHASAGMRRIISLAYLLVWAWQEHSAACQLRGAHPTGQVTFLVDEVEAHLHPQWQRRIVPALMAVMAELSGDRTVDVQLIAATHSPLVLASLEPLFDPDVDSWLDLDIAGEDRRVTLTKREFERLGDVSTWLTSPAFDLLQARSVQAEEAISEALKLTRERSPDRDDIERVNGLLQSSLGEISDWRCNMATTTVGIAQNGHLTIPKALRDKYNIKAGTRMEIVDLDGTIVLAKASSLDQMHSNLDRMHDLLESAGGSLDDMMSEIRQAREVA